MLKEPPSIIVALDTEIKEAVALARELREVKTKIAGFKVGSLQVLELGLKAIVSEIGVFSDIPIIYDHQKGCTDIPDIVEKQVKAIANSGATSTIAVPLGAGGRSLERFIETCKNNNVEPIVLLEMTHDGANDYLKDETAKTIFDKSVRLGVKYFVVPGTKIEKIKQYKKWADETGKEIYFVSPGLGAQGGNVTDAVSAGVDYPIIGRAIYQADNPKEVVERFHQECVEGFAKR